jgi:hypothetical protein
MAEPSAGDVLTERYLANVHRVDPLDVARYLRIVGDRRPCARNLDQQRMQATPLGITQAGSHLTHQGQVAVGLSARQQQ